MVDLPKKKKLTIVVEYLTLKDKSAAMRKITTGDYKLPLNEGSGSTIVSSDKELDGSERVRYKITSKLEE